MQVLEVQGKKISVSVDIDKVGFIGENGKEADRMTTKVTIWQHFQTNRKYQHLIPISTGFSFCQPNDPFDFVLATRQATTRALDNLGFRSNIHPVVKAVHKLVKQYAQVVDCGDCN